MSPAFSAALREWPSDAAFSRLVRAFWLGALRFAKALVRRDIQAAEANDRALKQALLTVHAWHHHAACGTDGMMSFEQRLLSQLDDPRATLTLRRASAAVDVANGWRLLTEIVQLFGELASELARLHGYAYPFDVETRVLRAIDPFRRRSGLTERRPLVGSR